MDVESFLTLVGIICLVYNVPLLVGTPFSFLWNYVNLETYMYTVIFITTPLLVAVLVLDRVVRPPKDTTGGPPK